MDIRALILKQLKKQGFVKAADIVKASGFSREYVDRFFRALREEGVLALIGKANQSRYVEAQTKQIEKAKRTLLVTSKVLLNKNLSEDKVLEQLKKETGIFLGLKKNVLGIIDYAFTEMLNNAIEHSQSKIIKIRMQIAKDIIRFEIADKGIGIFKHLIIHRRLKNELEAIGDLLKGKQTTKPGQHTGEGIFFTSKAADVLMIRSGNKQLLFNNLIPDVFIRDVKYFSGTKIIFNLSINSSRRLDRIFRAFTQGSFEFAKTQVVVRLYKLGKDYVSRSQARRILSGLDKFKVIILDFAGLETVGQAFADEVFRVWQHHHATIRLMVENANENVLFMINRAKGQLWKV